MKKLLPLFVIVLLLLTGCGTSPKKEAEQFYDQDALKNIALSLDRRWDYADSKEAMQADTIEMYKKSTQIEIDTLNSQDFSNKKFKDNKLKELYLAYKNQIDDIKKMLEHTSTSSIPEKWMELYDQRTKILSQINDIKEIPVKNKETLKELINNGNEVKETESVDKKINALLSSIKFSSQPQEYESDYKVYETNIENTTGKKFKTFGAKVYLENNEGIRVDTQYINISDWEPGQKVSVDFTTDKEFSKSTVVKDYYDLEN